MTREEHDEYVYVQGDEWWKEREAIHRQQFALFSLAFWTGFLWYVVIVVAMGVNR